jgi:hypothetical protein
MNDESNGVAKPDELLTVSMPDPAGPPRPVGKVEDPLRGLSVAGVVLVAAGGLLLPMMASTGATQGATRSAKIHWEQREAEVRRAMTEDQALSPADNNSTPSDTCGQAGAGERGGN